MFSPIQIAGTGNGHALGHGVEASLRLEFLLKGLTTSFQQGYVTPDRTAEKLHQATLNKRMALLRAGYTVIEMWECQWDRLVENEPAVSQFLRSFDLAPPMEPREAFFSGRTGAVALHAVAGECEEIRYVDVTTLYPWVNKNCSYPIGH